MIASARRNPIVLIVLLLVAAWSCKQPSRGADEQLVSLLDLIEESSLPSAGEKIVRVETIDPVTALREGRMTAGKGIEELRADGDSVLVRTGKVRNASFALDVDFDAADVNVIELVIDGGGQKLIQPKVEWVHGDEGFNWGKRVLFTQGEDKPGVASTLLAAVDKSDQWKNRIQGLSFAPSTAGGRTLRIESIGLLRVPFLAKKLLLERTEQRAVGPFTITEETREGLFAAPPFRTQCEVKVPRGGILEFGYGVIDENWFMPGDGVVLRAWVRAEGADRSETVFERYLDAKARPEDRGWFDERVYLDAYEGQFVTIGFETEGSLATAGESDTRFDDLVVSNPIVYRPGEDQPDRNVIVISLDTLRADHLSGYGYPRPTSPNLDRLSRRAVLFENASSQAPRTIDSHMSLFTSVFPSSHQMLDGRARLNPGYTTFPKEFKEREYHTAAFTESGFLGHQYGFQRGFDTYWEKPLTPGTGGSAQETFTAATDWVRRNHQKKFLMFVHTYEAHIPYCPIEPYKGLFQGDYRGGLTGCVSKKMISGYNGDQVHPDPDDWEYMVSLYDDEIRYLDAYLGRFLDALDETGIRDRTAVVVISDHGEEFMEHLMFGKHAHGIWQPSVHVPMLLDLPGVKAAAPRFPEPVSLIDVAPTLLEYVGFPLPSQFRGRSLLPRIRGREKPLPEGEQHLQYSENHGYAIRAMVRDDRYKLIHNYDEAEDKASTAKLYPEYAKNLMPHGEYELYDMREDPGERNNLADDKPEIRQEMMLQLHEMLSRAKAESKPATAGVLSESERQRLKDLGYAAEEIERDASDGNPEKERDDAIREESKEAGSKGDG